MHLFALKRCFCTPNFGRGVLILALWYGILIEKKEIEIYGADFSQFKEFKIDQNTNETTVLPMNFYERIDGQKEYKYKIKKGGEKQDGEYKIHIRLFNMYLMFKQMFLLSELAKIKGISVINYTYKSYLDCFDRPIK